MWEYVTEQLTNKQWEASFDKESDKNEVDQLSPPNRIGETNQGSSLLIRRGLKITVWDYSTTILPTMPAPRWGSQ